MSKCQICGCELGETPMCFGAGSPASQMVPKDQYEDRVIENTDQCIVDGKNYFVRGHIELPVNDTGTVFIWSVWVSLSEDNFRHMSENWETPGRETIEPYFGWLMTNLPCYPSTMHLRTNVQSQPVGCVPLISIQPSDHPLSHEQQHGITMQRVHEIVHQVMAH